MNRTLHCFFGVDDMVPDFVCYNVQRCPFLPSTFKIANLTCIDLKQMNIRRSDQLIDLFHTCLTIDIRGNETHCRDLSLFHCPGTSKCISKHRLLDGIVDCYGGADEDYNNTCNLNQTHRFQCLSENKCLSHVLIQDQIKHCKDGEDEVIPSEKKLSFQDVCNGYIHLSPDLINGQNETDETNCEQWPCINQYTRCDGAWTCSNGADELGCNPLSKCYPDQHECVLPITFKVICLPLNRTGDGKIDCLGATDEREHCRQLQLNQPTPYRCWNDTYCVSEGCFGSLACDNEHKPSTYSACTKDQEIGAVFDSLEADVILKGIDFIGSRYVSNYKYFTLYPSNHLSINTRPAHLKIMHDTYPSTFNEPKIQDQTIDLRQIFICNRGILVYIGINMTERCLCPPSYYGDRCEFQSQRVSITLQFSKECAPNCLGIYAIVMSLLDNHRIIHSYEQLTYITTMNCSMKYNIYFLYQSRSKDLTKNYIIHIDVYNKINLTYYSSWILPINLLFLPVNRIATHLIIPSYPMNIVDDNKCPFVCGNHGRCIKYSNKDKYFCRCELDWSGSNCTIYKNQCDCASDSRCLGVVNKRSICLCPLNQMGPRCFLHSICQQNPCKNGGYCVPEDDRTSMINFTCVCLEGYFGRTCEIKGSHIDISFRKIPIPQFLMIHLITVQLNDFPLITTIWKKISLDEDTATLYTSISFNLIILQIHGEYYLPFLSINATEQTHHELEVKPSHNCSHVSQLLDQQIADFPLLRRVKYYHIICQEKAHVNCFHDNEAFMCLCNNDRHANCFNFDFAKKSTCSGSSKCESQGQCVQDRSMCPSSTMCICLECYYGGKCQLTTEGFGLSLDVLLAYQIRPHKSMTHQRSIVYVSITITTLMLLINLISSTLSAMTFRSEKLREVGCGTYLFYLSIISILSIVLLNLKLWLFILSQMLWIPNRLILQIYCISMEFLLQSLLAIGDWLSACVAIERTFVVKKGVSFNKKKSKQAAKWIIIIVIILTMISYIYDPIYRRLIDDEEEQRTWCIVQYSSLMRILDSIIHFLHFIIPFLINLLSAVFVIINAARTHANARKKQTYKQHLKEQLQHQKHLIISPIILIIFSTPRLIITFLSGCMKSNRDPWLFLFGYYISFVPSLLILVVFILPSKVYKKEFDTIIERLKRIIPNYLHRN